MIAYMCKYVPVELLEAFGTPAAIMEPHVTNFTEADSLMHPNICSFVKAVLEEFENSSWDGMLLTTCCDSSRRLYDTLCRLHPDKFFFCFDLPRKNSGFAATLYAEQMDKFIEEYAAFSGRTFDVGKLVGFCADEADALTEKRDVKLHVHCGGSRADDVEQEQGRYSLNVCLAGARPGTEIKRLIEELGAHIALDLTCTGVTRGFKIEIDESENGRDFGVDQGSARRKDILKSYASALLGQIPCMRMAQVDGRAEAMVAQAGSIDGILYHTVKFCDIYSYEYTRFRQTLGLPIVKIETDATNQCAGQILTRVEAFLESLRARRNSAAAAADKSVSDEGLYADAEEDGGRTATACTGWEDAEEFNGTEHPDECDCCPDYELGTSAVSRIVPEDVEADRSGGVRERGNQKFNAQEEQARGIPEAAIERKGDRTMYIMGIDSGSTSTNAVIINEKKEILSYAVLRTGAKSADSAERILNEVLEKACLQRDDLSRIVSTGYGRVSIPFADKNVTEISCHGRGAHFLNPGVRTILDIGGQDSKAIRINENGDVVDFVMNDKCAAGTGRFLEMMARTLEVDIEELGPLSLQSKENVEISSMCSVFAESEVISLIAQNKEPADIARGIHRAIAGKAVSLLKKVGLEREFMMTGGVAKNPGMIAVLEEMLGASMSIYKEPEIVGALGAALFALE